MKNIVKAVLVTVALAGSSALFAQDDNEAMEQALQNQINEMISGGSNINATVDDGGIVTLTGNASDEIEEGKIINHVKGMDGVNEVRDDISVN